MDLVDRHGPLAGRDRQTLDRPFRTSPGRRCRYPGLEKVGKTVERPIGWRSEGEVVEPGTYEAFVVAIDGAIQPLRAWSCADEDEQRVG